MSSLWTPSGEHFPKKEGEEGPGRAPSPPPGAPGAGGGPGQPGPPGSGTRGPVSEAEAAEAQAAVDAMREQLLGTPAEVVVANHCYGLFELAAIYLSNTPPMLFQARLAIDALSAVLDGVQGRLGEAEPALRESLSQLRLAFVRLEGSEQSPEDSAGGG